MVVLGGGLCYGFLFVLIFVWWFFFFFNLVLVHVFETLSLSCLIAED